MGDVEKVSANGGWEAAFRRDELGLELERLLPGGLRSQWQRDRLGRPTEQRLVKAGGNVHRTRTYTWDVNDRLRQISDSVGGITQFEHDAFGNLAAARYGDGHTDYRMPDAVGNLFRRGDRGDRKYGPAGQLLEAQGTRYRYDAEGNLVEKREPAGQTWHYAWNAAGMLVRVTRPDGQDVFFTYDALGRRLSKTYRHKTTRWVWDGNVPLHEWTEKRLFTQVYADDDRIAGALRGNAAMSDPASPGFGPLPDALTTWVFEPESFAPVAKLSGGAHYSIVTDHLGTPLTLFSDRGEAVWQMELSVYGEVRELKGWRESCPFRYPGQYEDTETGLYYNRFRYYDPGAGIYISQDPIGLAGGLKIYSYVCDPNTYVDTLGLFEAFDVVPYGAKTAPLENHHGVLDVWASHNIPGYVSRASDNPAIALTKEQHSATKKVYRDWLRERTGKPIGGKIDWTKISAIEAQDLSERMFDAANVPHSARQNYYRDFHKYIYRKCP
jgi:RHS repeat-associated protein